MRFKTQFLNLLIYRNSKDPYRCIRPQVSQFIYQKATWRVCIGLLHQGPGRRLGEKILWYWYYHLSREHRGGILWLGALCMKYIMLVSTRLMNNLFYSQPQALSNHLRSLLKFILGTWQNSLSIIACWTTRKMLLLYIKPTLWKKATGYF